MGKKELLFELMKDPGDQPQPEPQGFWQRLRAKRYGTEQPAQPAPVPVEPPSETGEAPPPPVADPTPYDRGPSEVRRISLNTPTVVGAVVLALLVFFIGYLAGRTGTDQDEAAERSQAQINEIADRDPQEDVLQALPPVPRNAQQARVEPAAATPPARTAPIEADSGEKKARNPALNYLIIQRFPTEESALRAQRFLTEKGVATTIEGQGRFFELVSVKGFNFPTERDQFDRFQQAIKVYGRQYARTPGGDADFETCYAKKGSLFN